MKIVKNLIENQKGTIDCILVHETYGEVPHTLILSEDYTIHPESDWEGCKLLTQTEKDSFTLQESKETKIAEINLVCANLITRGFISSALGKPYLYQSTVEDQTNLKTAAQSYKDRAFKCESIATGEVAFCVHTQAQIQAVHEDFCDLLEACLLHAFNKKKEIKSAKSAEDLKLIKW